MYQTKFEARFLCPRFWGIWFGVGLLWLLSRLPYQAKFKAGRVLGRLMYVLAPSRRRLAKANIQIAFPDKSESQLKQLVVQHFTSLGVSLIEMAIVWWGDYKKHPDNAFEKSLVTYQGLEHLKQAIDAKKGVLIVAPHFTTLEMTGLFISFITHFNAVYRPHDNPLMDYLIAKGRSIPMPNGQTVSPIANNNTRGMLKVLRNGECMTILPDQKYGDKGHVVVDFFNKPAKSNPATSKLAKLTSCAVVPCLTRRDENNHYTLTFLPALDDFPSEDFAADTLRLHAIYQQAIEAQPDQYLWVHNRWSLNKKTLNT